VSSAPYIIGPEPVPVVVELLADMLERAKAGEIIAIAAATANHGRATSTSYALCDANIADLYLAIDRLRERLRAEGEEL